MTPARRTTAQERAAVAYIAGQDYKSKQSQLILAIINERDAFERALRDAKLALASDRWEQAEQIINEALHA